MTTFRLTTIFTFFSLLALASNGYADELPLNLMTQSSEIIPSTHLTPCVAPKGFTKLRTPQDLQSIENDLFGRYFLCNDLDMSDFAFSPLGAWADSFMGTLEGNGRSIRNLSIARDQLRVGLFDTIGIYGEVRNLRVTDPIIVNEYSECTGGTSCANAGAIAGTSRGSIENIRIVGLGSIQGFRGVGGIVGTNNGLISRSSVGSEIEIMAHGYAGGIAGNNYKSAYQYIGTVEDSYSLASVSALTHTAGGLVGSNGYAGTIMNSYSNASAILGDQIGALVGSNFGAYIDGSPVSAVIASSYAVDHGLPLVFNNSFLGVIYDSEVYSFDEMSQVPQPDYLYIGWDFVGVWLHVDGALPEVRD